MNNNEKVAREIFGEINEKDDYFIGMMAENPSIKWRRFESVWCDEVRDPTNGDQLREISQIWNKTEIKSERSERRIGAQKMVWIVNSDEHYAIKAYEYKNLKKINKNRKSIVQYWDKLHQLPH
jgi:hypothetical protein